MRRCQKPTEWSCACREGRQGQKVMLSTKIPNDSPGLALLTRHFVIAVATVGSFAYQHVPTRMSGRLAVQDGPNPSDRGGLDLGRKMAAHVRASTAKHEHDHVPQAAGRVVRDNPLLSERVRIPASGDIRASLFHGEEQIAAFGATKPIRRLSFGACPPPSARWAAFSSTG